MTGLFNFPQPGLSLVRHAILGVSSTGSGNQVRVDFRDASGNPITVPSGTVLNVSGDFEYLSGLGSQVAIQPVAPNSANDTIGSNGPFSSAITLNDDTTGVVFLFNNLTTGGFKSLSIDY